MARNLNETKIIRRISETGLLPVANISRKEEIIGLCEVLNDTGLPIVEITYRTAFATSAISITATQFPDILVGAGTVLSIGQAADAISAGAKFIVTPGLDGEIVAWCMERETPIFPGVLTPSEITAALKLGVNILKFFPSEDIGGIPYLRNISGPFQNVKFIPTGGIDLSNLRNYLALPIVHACAGSWLAETGYVQNNRFDELKIIIKKSIQIVSEFRGAGDG